MVGPLVYPVPLPVRIAFEEHRATAFINGKIERAEIYTKALHKSSDIICQFRYFRDGLPSDVALTATPIQRGVGVLSRMNFREKYLLTDHVHPELMLFRDDPLINRRAMSNGIVRLAY